MKNKIITKYSDATVLFRIQKSGNHVIYPMKVYFHLIISLSSIMSGIGPKFWGSIFSLPKIHVPRDFPAVELCDFFNILNPTAENPSGTEIQGFSAQIIMPLRFYR